MRRTKVFWKERGRKFKCPPRAFHKIAEEHERAYGGLDAALLLEQSRKAKHPMHDDVWAESRGFRPPWRDAASARNRSQASTIRTCRSYDVRASSPNVMSPWQSSTMPSIEVSRR